MSLNGIEKEGERHMIFISKKQGQPLYEQLFTILQKQIIKRELKRDTALKPIRVLAEELHVSNNTVNRAYQQLLEEGYIRSVPGSGYYVEDVEKLPCVKKVLKHQAHAGNHPESREKIQYDFSYDNVESDTFPWTKWRRYMQDAMLEESYDRELRYEQNKGNLELRSSLCTYLNNSRGVNCKPEQIIICAGTQYAMDIITNILPKKKYRVAVEEPGYDGMRQIFLNKGYKITPISMTYHGMYLKQLEQSDCNLLYITPSHQFPTGLTTTLEERVKILDWASRNQAYIIENDYDNEFTYGKKPLPSMQFLDKEESVIYLGSLSKVLSPSLRCAYCVLPMSLLEVYENKYRFYYSALPTYNQRALAHFINDGNLAKHVRKMSLLNKRKYEIFYQSMKRYLPEEVELFPSTAGSHVLIKINGCTSQRDMIHQLYERGIRIYSTKGYWYNKQKVSENIFLMGYSAFAEEELEDACAQFARNLKEILQSKSEIKD